MRLPWVRKPAFWTACFVVLGIVLRVYHYARNPSIWHDEAALILNVIGKNFAELLGPLRFSEAAPPLFLWIALPVFLTLGDGTYALRVVPFVASCLALVLLAVVARRLLAAEAVPWVVLPFAVADTILWHSCEAKPYAVDLLSATSLLAIYCCTSSWRLEMRLALCIAVAPVIIFLTYPGCFLMGGLLVAILPDVCRARRRATAWPLFALLSLVVAGSFAFLLLGPIHAQRDGAMASCWVDLFAPWPKPWKVPVWALASTLEVFRYCCPPSGQPCILLAVIGVVHLARRGEWGLLNLLLIPVLLAFLAACAQAYPYGGARVLVYAAPGLLLLIGAGTPAALSWLFARSRLAAAGLLILLLVPAASGLTHVIWPWGRADAAGAASYVLAHRLSGDRLSGNHWEYLYYFRHVHAEFQPWEDLSLPMSGRLWLVITGTTPPERQRLGEYYGKLQGKIVEQQSFERTTVLLLEPIDSANITADSEPTRTAAPHP